MLPNVKNQIKCNLICKIQPNVAKSIKSIKILQNHYNKIQLCKITIIFTKVIKFVNHMKCLQIFKFNLNLTESLKSNEMLQKIENIVKCCSKKV